MITGAEIGMLIVETIAKIRCAFFVQGKPIKAICRELGLSRKVVRKVLRSKATEFRYEREAQPLPKIGPWSDKLDQLLLANDGKAARERLTLIRHGVTVTVKAAHARLCHSRMMFVRTYLSAGSCPLDVRGRMAVQIISNLRLSPC
jgi:hypothetical protein